VGREQQVTRIEAASIAPSLELPKSSTREDQNEKRLPASKATRSKFTVGSCINFFNKTCKTYNSHKNRLNATPLLCCGEILCDLRAPRTWHLYVQCKKNQRGRWWAELLSIRRNRRKKLIEEGRLSGLGFRARTFKVAYLKYHWSCCCCCICMHSVGRIRDELKYCWNRKQEEEGW
jgi:hypothetical protein